MADRKSIANRHRQPTEIYGHVTSLFGPGDFVPRAYFRYPDDFRKSAEKVAGPRYTIQRLARWVAQPVDDVMSS